MNICVLVSVLIAATCATGSETGTMKCYSYNDPNTLQPCVKVCFQDMELTLYQTGTNTNQVYKMNKITRLDGTCPIRYSSNYVTSSLTFHSTNSSVKLELTLSFRLNLESTNDYIFSAKDIWYVYAIHISSNYLHSYGYNLSSSNPTFFAHARQAYKCVASLIVPLSGHYSTQYGTINLTNYMMQPFNLSDTEFDFKYFATCREAGIPFYIPILVAGILATFVLILVLTYLIGCFNRRNTRRYTRLLYE